VWPETGNSAISAIVKEPRQRREKETGQGDLAVRSPADVGFSEVTRTQAPHGTGFKPGSQVSTAVFDLPWDKIFGPKPWGAIVKYEGLFDVVGLSAQLG
jgi:hypothetical protein